MKLFMLVAAALSAVRPQSELLIAEDGKAVYVDGEKHFKVGYTVAGEGEDQKVDLASEHIEVTPVTRFAEVGKEAEAFTVLQGVPHATHDQVMKELTDAKGELKTLVPVCAQALYDVGVRRGTLMPSGKEGYLAKGSKGGKDLEDLRKMVYEGKRVIPGPVTPDTQPSQQGVGSPACAQTGGKKWEDLSNMEKDALHKSDKEAFSALHEDYQRRLAGGEVKKK